MAKRSEDNRGQKPEQPAAKSKQEGQSPDLSNLENKLPPRQEKKAKLDVELVTKRLESLRDEKSFRNLPEKMQADIRRNFAFIDAADHHDALILSIGRHKGILHPALYMHEYYMASKNPKIGRYQDSLVFEKYKVASAFAETNAKEGVPISPSVQRNINSLINYGNLEGHDDSARLPIVREWKPVFVRRPLEEIRGVFDENGKYKTGGPVPPVSGFFSGEVKDFRQAADRKINSVILIDEFRKLDVTNLNLKALNERLSSASLIAVIETLDAAGDFHRLLRKILRDEISSRLMPSPHHVHTKDCAVIFSNDPSALTKHLEEIGSYYKRAANYIIEATKLNSSSKNYIEPASERYVRVTSLLAARIARVTDMGHFAADGMGRTSLLTERYILMQFGLTPPLFIEDKSEVNNKSYENGTYRDESHRASLLAGSILKSRVNRNDCEVALLKLERSI